VPREGFEESRGQPLGPLGSAELSKRLPLGSRFAELKKRHPLDAKIQVKGKDVKPLESFCLRSYYGISVDLCPISTRLK
jgi:hypothetical protein